MPGHRAAVGRMVAMPAPRGRARSCCNRGTPGHATGAVRRRVGVVSAR